MAVELTTLRLFVATAERGSFAAAAREFALDPSIVSRAVASLEKALATRLFQRTTRRMVLTEAGERYLSEVRAALDRLDAATDEVRSSTGQPTGKVRLTTSVAFGTKWLIPRLSMFRQAYPGISLDLVLSDANLDLIEERIDVAIRLAPSYRADVVGTRLIDTRYRVVASPAYFAKKGRPSVPAELSGHDCLRFALPAFRDRWLFRKVGTERVEAVTVGGTIVLSNALALREAALAGLGPALLADWLIGDDLASGAMQDLFPEHDAAATEFETGAWVLYPSRRQMPRRVRTTLDFLKKSAGDQSAK